MKNQLNSTPQPDDANSEIPKSVLDRRQFLTMGLGAAAAAFALPRPAKATTSIIPDASTELAFVSGKVSTGTFPQPVAGSLGTLADPSQLYVLWDTTDNVSVCSDGSYPVSGSCAAGGAPTDKSFITSRFYSNTSSSSFDPKITTLTPGTKVFQPGPTFRFYPSQSDKNSLHLTFNNKMPHNDSPELGMQGIPLPDPYTSSGCDGSIDRPRCFQTSNLHFHGFHVSPISLDTTDPTTGQPVFGPGSDAQLSSDDMLFELLPEGENGSSGQHDYCVQLPEFHAPGTHWYHAHTHGSTAIHIIDGMAGALIVEEEGDYVIPVDDDKIWLLQETLSPPPNPSGYEQTYSKIRNTRQSNGTKTGPIFPVPNDQEVYACTGGGGSAGFTVNGVYQPTLNMQPRELQRWRFINGTATPRGFIRLSLVMPVKYTYQSGENAGQTVTLSNPTTDPNALLSNSNYQAAFNDPGNATTQTQCMSLIATDGISFFGKPPHPKKTMDLVAANRADFLVKLPLPGVYWVLKEVLPAGAGQRNPGGVGPNKGVATPGALQILATVVVSGTAVSPEKSIPTVIPGQPPNYLQPITEDQLLTYEENGTQKRYLRPVVFDITGEFTTQGCKNYQGGGKGLAPPLPRQFNINNVGYTGKYGDQYTSYTPPPIAVGTLYKPGTYLGPGTIPPTQGPARYDTVQVVKLNTAEEWIIFNYSGLTHPFHIHVNPFQVVEIYTPNADNTTTPITQTVDVNDRVWWDTFGVPPASFKTNAQNQTVVDQPGYIRIRTRFWDYWGEYVFHCHILIHEDLGMMQNVMVLPDNASSSDPTIRGYNPCAQATTSATPGSSGSISFPSGDCPTGFFYPAPVPVDANGNIDRNTNKYFNPFVQGEVYPCQYSIPQFNKPLNPVQANNTASVAAEPEQSCSTAPANWPAPCVIAPPSSQ